MSDRTRFLAISPRLPVRERDPVVAFHTERLRFVVTALWPASDPTFAILRRDDVVVQFYRAGQDPPEPVGHGSVCIDVSDRSTRC